MQQNNKYYYSILILFASFANWFANGTIMCAQGNISFEHNCLRANDSIQRQEIEFFYVGDSGDDITWDFPQLNYITSYPVSLFCDSDSVFLGEITPHQILRYAMRHDSLMLISQESPMEIVTFNRPVSVLAYPFSYSDSYSDTYYGSGIYCQTHNIDKGGSISVSADGRGTLILGEDTLENTIRIHRMRTGYIRMFDVEDSIEPHDRWQKQEIEECYLWYARGYRYPVLETISTSYYDNMELVSCIQKAYCSNPEQQSLIDDAHNEGIRYADSLMNGHISRPDIIHYSISSSGSYITLSFSLLADASISLLVCNRVGMVYRRDSFTTPAGQDYVREMDCSGLTPDTYILYINVNGMIYSEKLKL